MTARTLSVTLTSKATCKRVRRYFADRNILCEFMPLASRGYYLFVMHVPTRWDEAAARNALGAALPLEPLADAKFCAGGAA